MVTARCHEMGAGAVAGGAGGVTWGSGETDWPPVWPGPGREEDASSFIGSYVPVTEPGQLLFLTLCRVLGPDEDILRARERR